MDKEKTTRQRLAAWSKTPEGRESHEKVASEMRKQISEDEELEKEISKSIENLEGCTTKINDNPEYHLISDEDIRKFARHFAEWGAEHLADANKMSPNDLDFEQELYNHFGQIKDFTLGMRIGQYFYNLGRDSVPLPEDTVLFNKGVEEGKRLMVEEAVEGEYGYFSNATKTILPSGKLNLKEGDKVHIIIVKENEK